MGWVAVGVLAGLFVIARRRRDDVLDVGPSQTISTFNMERRKRVPQRTRSALRAATELLR